MSSVPTRRAPLLDLAAAMGLCGPALMVLYSYDRRPFWMSLAVVLLLTVAIVIWVLWRRTGQRSGTAAIAFAVTATLTMTLGDGSLYYGIIWAACLVLGITFASGFVLWGYAAALVALVVALHLSAGSSVELMVGEAIAAMFFAGIAAAVAAILHDSLRVDETLRGALRQLDAANADLRGRLDTDRDLVLARERERTARELHDSLGQRLTAIGLSIDYAARVDDPEAARAELTRARKLVGESLDSMRRLVRAMHPVELSTLRNADAFRAVAEAFRGTGIAIQVSTHGDDSALSHEHSLLLLRFVQEGLTNIVRHSDSTNADLHVIVGDSDDVDAGTAAVRAVLEDRGAAPPATPPAEGFGLRSLRTRAETLGGTLEATPTTSGFRLVLTLPTMHDVHLAPIAPVRGAA
jgi:signal transduction histidine kinase